VSITEAGSGSTVTGTETAATSAAPVDAATEPVATTTVELPDDGRGYRLKRKLLGPPLRTEELEHERLGKPTALAVFASDNLSSSAYATEEILRVLIPAIGIGAFALVTPITIGWLVVLGFLILSYRQTIKAYPTAGGAYMVTRDNFGLLPAQVAGVALLTDYVLTVAVSVAAGTAALASAFSVFQPWILPISVAFVLLISFGNLRGVRESGKIFAIPTYFFIFNMAVLLGWGVYQLMVGHLPTIHRAHGMVPFGHQVDGALFLGASVYVVMHAFASGGAAVTGVEAVSNGVPAFRKPEWKNARTTLVIMGSLLGVMFLGVSALAGHLHATPYESGTPTVISQVGDFVYGPGALGRVFYLCLQAGTMLILVLAANTSFADFPRLASFHAGDNFMPRQLTKRGHRLVFSNGIIFLATTAIALLIVTNARVDKLIPLYALGVFTSFTLSQAGMAKHHIREKEKGWRWGLFVNGVGAVLSLIVDIVIAITKFTHGAWAIVVFVPVMVFFLVRLSKQYETEAEQLEADVPSAIAAPIFRRHVVLVFIDRLDLAAVRAVQYARTLMPDELRAVHFVLDEHHADALMAAWIEYGMAQIELDLVDCADRRITRAAVEATARDLADGQTEVSVLLPERKYRGVWHRILHDQTADAIVRAVSRLPHANVTTVPFHFDMQGRRVERTRSIVTPSRVPAGRNGNGRTATDASAENNDDTGLAPIVPAASGSVSPIAAVRLREQVRVEGRVETLRVRPLAGTATLEGVINDGTGALSIVFFGRSKVRGIKVGTVLRITGTATEHHGRLAILNPIYELVVDA
jgi:amino acid transporter